MKGFTLVEMLVVIVILTFVFAISVPIVINYLKKMSEETYKRQIESIENAAEGWAAENLKFLPENEGGFITIYLGELKNSGLIKDDLRNPVSNELFFDDMEILIQFNGGNYDFTVKPETGTGTTDFSSLNPIIVLNGSSSEITEINEPYVDKGVQITDRFGKKIDEYAILYKSNGIEIEDLDTSRLATYVVEYVINGIDGKVSAFRTVEVTDTINPVISFSGNIELFVSEVTTFDAMANITVTDNSADEVVTIASGNLSAIPGTYQITYTATDTSGNVSQSNRTVTVIADPVNEIVIFSKNGDSSYAKSNSTVVTTSDIPNTIVSRKYIWNNSTSAPSSGSFVNTFSSGDNLSTPAAVTGTYYLWVQVIDNLDNETKVRTNGFFLDNVVPSVTSVSLSTANITTNSFDIIRTGNATDSSSGLATLPYVYQVSTDDLSWSTISTSNSTTSTVTGLNQSTYYYYRVCALDKAGNEKCTLSKKMATRPTIPDVTLPTITFTPNTGRKTQEFYNVVVSVSDNELITTSQYAWSTSNVTQPGAISYKNFVPGATIKTPVGTATWYMWVKAIDNSDNTQTECSGSFSIEQVITTECPPNYLPSCGEYGCQCLPG